MGRDPNFESSREAFFKATDTADAGGAVAATAHEVAETDKSLLETEAKET